MKILGLRCGHLIDPMGVDDVRPKFSWRLEADESDGRGLCQSGYRITAFQSWPQVSGTNTLWDSGKVESDQSQFVEYCGPALSSRQRIEWQVEVWDQKGRSSTSATASFEMGLLDASDWQGCKWIASPLYGGKYTTVPSPFLRREFTLGSQPKRARLYITALGVYDASINGERVSQDLFSPGWTDTLKRVQYQVYDVTALLKEGDNAIGAILGDGWYCGYNGWFGRQIHGDRPKLLARLEIIGEDGSETVITTDGTWKWSVGPILESDLIMGESYDARHDLGDWSKPGYGESTWLPVQVVDNAPGQAILTAMPGPPVCRHEELVPVSVPKNVNGKWIFDFGQNMVGWVRLKVSGSAGQTVTLRFAEMLQPSGEIYTENLRAAKQTDRYTLAGSGVEVYEPRFTFHGFRYVELSGLSGEPSVDIITGIVVHSDMAVSGTFECSNPLLNQLQHNIEWGLKGNFVDVPTDCPQRDERLGWTGDAQVFVGTAALNRDVGGFFTKWLRDLRDSQDSEGHFPMVAPAMPELGPDGKPAWADAGVICPWTIYRSYGDKGILAENYDSMRAFVESLVRDAPDLIRCNPAHTEWGGFGDWLSIEANTPPEIIGTAFFSYSAKLLSQIAAILGDDTESKRYEELSNKVRAAFIERFVTNEGIVAGQTQTAYVLALHFDLLPEHLRSKAADYLERDIRARGTHLSTGFVGTPYLLHVLSNCGKTGLAYELLLQKTFPSWLYPITQGATTIWERWDGWTHEKGFQDAGMNSFNHYAYGAVGDWLYKCVAGLQIDPSPEGAGYRKIIFEPKPGGGLSHAGATHESRYGKIASAWKITGGELLWSAVVPPNTSARAVLPGRAVSITEGSVPLSNAEGASEVIEPSDGRTEFTLAPGSYEFRISGFLPSV